MQLHQISKFNFQRKKRIGRGGKRGSYSGRGVKGQKSRSGRRLRPAERDLIIRLPKRRGFRNLPRSGKPEILNLEDLSLAIKSSGKGPITIDLDFLKKTGLLPISFRGDVKILGDGEIQSPIIVKKLKISANAKKKIEKAGGKITD